MLVRTRIAVPAIVILITFCCFGAERSGVAGSCKEGDVLLKKADFDGAIRAYLTAAKADPARIELANKARLIRRVQNIRKLMDSGSLCPVRWEAAAVSVHTFYLQHGVSQEAVALGRTAHEKLKNVTSVAMLAEALLEAKQNSEAVKFLERLDPKLLVPRNHLTLGIALARERQTKKAKAVAKLFESEKKTDPHLLYSLARLNALLGNKKPCFRQLKACFQATPPALLASFREHVRINPDFTSIASKPRFGKVLATPSKITVSACSQGASCASCPQRGGCATVPPAAASAKPSGCSGCPSQKTCGQTKR